MNNLVSMYVISANLNESNENNNPLVLYGIIDYERYLFTGDIEMDTEKEFTIKMVDNIIYAKVKKIV